MEKEAKEAKEGRAENGLDCPDGGGCRFANPALEEVARLAGSNKR